VRFYVGLHQPSDGRRFERACISINRLLARKKPVGCKVLLDSGAFTEISTHGRYRTDVAEYARRIRRIVDGGVAEIEVAVAQDYMCEPFILAKTGLTVEDHQRLTIERYDALLAENLPVPIMPVLQGYSVEDYRRHLVAYGERLTPGMWVGVGSVCKRNSDPSQVLAILSAIKELRPDLLLHGFGLKTTALMVPEICAALHSSDSMAWSFSARKQGRNGNSWLEAQAFAAKIGAITDGDATRSAA
jgi:hypothetical protein